MKKHISFVLFCLMALLSGCTQPITREVVALEPMTTIGSSSSLYLDASGTLWAWGANLNGDLGNSDKIIKTDKAIPILKNIVKCDSFNHYIALDKDGVVWQWGSNAHSAFGTMTESYYSEPVKMFEDAADILIAGNSTLAIKKDGSLWSWGNKEVYGKIQKLKDDSQNGRDPYKITDNVVKIKSFRSFNIGALKSDGSLLLWGNNDYGQIGNGKIGDGVEDSDDLQFVPYKVNLKNVTDFAIGYGHVAALCEDGSLWTWGNNEAGQVGNGSNGDGTSATIDCVVKKPIKIMENVMYCDAFNNNTCAIDNQNSLYIWGDNTFGQCGDGTAGNIAVQQKTNIHNTPYLLTDDVKRVFLSQVTFVIKNDNTLWGCGNNGYCMLGAGIRVSRVKDVSEADKIAISKLTYVTDNADTLSKPAAFTCALIKNDGSVWQWGQDPYHEGSGIMADSAGKAEAAAETEAVKDHAMKESPVKLEFSNP